MKDKLIRILTNYGLMNQLKHFNSEVFELNEAIMNFQSAVYYDACRDKDHIIEEMADVMVMLKQFQLFYGIENEEIVKIMKQKIDRQLERIAEEYK